MFVSQDYTLCKTWHKNPNRKQSARPVTVKLVSLTCMQCFCAVASCSSVMTLQFSFFWHKRGVKLLLPAFSCTHKLDWCNALLCFHPSCLHTFVTWSHHFLLKFLHWYVRNFFFASSAYTMSCERNGLCRQKNFAVTRRAFAVRFLLA